jgi:hypothetical protein
MLERTDQPDTYHLRYTGEVDPLLAISPSRYERLLNLQAQADAMSTYHLLIELMRDHPARGGLPNLAQRAEHHPSHAPRADCLRAERVPVLRAAPRLARVAPQRGRHRQAHHQKSAFLSAGVK